MKTIVVLFALTAVALAAPQIQQRQQLQQNEQPQDQESPSQNPEATAEVLRSVSDIGPEGYSWEYETSNQIKANEQGQLKEIGTEKGIAVQGSYSYIAPDGTPVSISYIADENGFQPQGDILPTPPPVPEAILRVLEYLQNHPPQEELQEQPQQ